MSGRGPVVRSSNAHDAGQIAFAGNDIVGEDAGKVTLTLLRSGSTNAVSVSYATSNGDSQGDPAAKAGTNYTASNGTVNWAAGDGSAKTISIPIINTKSIAKETKGGADFLHFTVTLSGATGGAVLGCLPQDNVAVVNPANSPAGATTTPPPPPPPSSGGKSGGGLFDLFSLLTAGVTMLRRRKRRHSA